MPLFQVGSQGGADGPAVWWQRREMLVALLHTGCGPCTLLRSGLAARGADLRARDAAELALEVDGAGPERERSGAVARSLGLDPGAAVLIVADRYGEAFASLPIHGADAGAVLDEAESWLDHIQQQCPE